MNLKLDTILFVDAGGQIWVQPFLGQKMKPELIASAVMLASGLGDAAYGRQVKVDLAVGEAQIVRREDEV